MPSTTRHKLESSAQLALTGMGLNAVICAAKIGVGLAGHSYALIADGFESLLDIISSLLTWAGLKVAARPPDSNHPYGHGKAEPLVAILGSIMILGAAAVIAIESIHALSSPRLQPRPYTLLVLIIVVIVKELHSRRVKKLARETASMAMEADAAHHRTDAITSAAAFIGITIALVGGKGISGLWIVSGSAGVIVASGQSRAYESADSWAALIACAIIAYNGVLVFWPSLRDLMDTAPPRNVEEQVRKAAADVEGVVEIEQCRMRKMGLEYYVDLHVKVNGQISVIAGHEIAHRVKDAVRGRCRRWPMCWCTSSRQGITTCNAPYRL